MSKKLITSAMAAEILGFTPDYVRRLISQGKIVAVKLGHDWLIELNAISKIKRVRNAKKKDDINGKDQ